MKDTQDCDKVSPSYCSIHNIYPAKGEPCYQCVQAHGRDMFEIGYKECAKNIRSMIQSLIKDAT